MCNGCQLFSQLRTLIPGAQDWPLFKQNMSGRFEGRASLVEIDAPEDQPSVFLRGMHGSVLPVAVAHGEGRATWPAGSDKTKSNVCVRYVDPAGQRTERYPYNPNGSPDGVTGVHALEGRVLALMPHPERVVRARTNSWLPPKEAKVWGGRGPWIRLFENAREWVN